MRRRAWLVYLLGGSAATAAYFVAPMVKGNGLWFNLIGLSAAVAIVAGVKMYKPKPAAAWWLFAVAQVTFVIGDAVYYNWKPLFPSIGDIFYLAFYPIQVVGLLMLIRRRSGGKDFRSFLDAAILTVGLGVLSWAFLIQPHFQDPGLTAVERLVSLSYPLMDLALLAVTARMAVGAWPRHPAFYLLGAGLMSMLITDAVYGFIELQGGYDPGGALDSGWLIYYLLWGAAALHPSMTKLSEPAGVGPPLTWRRLALLSAATLIAPVADAIESGPDTMAYSIFSAVLFLLVAARMTGLITSMDTIQRRRSEERITALVRHSSDVITVVDSDLVIRYQTPSSQKVLGYTPDEMMGSELTQLVHQEDRGGFLDFFRSPVAGENLQVSDRLEWRLMHKEGHWVPVEAIVNNLLDDPGVRGLVLT
ncbi:MAG: PAS domain-containing protein, partial [Actinomycetota bacterium]